MSGNVIQLNEDLIKDNVKDLVDSSIEETLNALLNHEADELVKAEKYGRSGEHQGYRSGHYSRNFSTTAGDVRLKMPKIKGVPFETAIIERYKRRETSVEEALIEMSLAGVSVHRYIGLFTTRISKEKPPPVRQQLFLQVPIVIPVHRAVLFSISNGSFPVIRDLFHLDRFQMIEGRSDVFGNMSRSLTEYPIEPDPCISMNIAGEILPGIEFKIHIPACAVRAGRSIATDEIMPIDRQKIPFDHHGFIMIIVIMHVPVVNLRHIVSITHHNVRMVIWKHLLILCDIILHFKIRVNDISLTVLLHAFG